MQECLRTFIPYSRHVVQQVSSVEDQGEKEKPVRIKKRIFHPDNDEEDGNDDSDAEKNVKYKQPLRKGRYYVQRLVEVCSASVSV